jgi:tRNA U34 5-methylaminomethyl-2-thiouridine-forming methyltransferase MnmC
MERKIVLTGDGSHSIGIPELNITYHSVHGAIQESRHVFIEAGLNYVLSNSTFQSLRIFEMGLGTGLNVLLTAIEAERNKISIQYTTVEQFPLRPEEVHLLNYAQVLGNVEFFHKIHDSKWNEPVRINEHFTLEKLETDLLNFSSSPHFDLIYYDAFAPNAQPELWTKEIFEKLFSMIEPGGVVVTYCSKGDVRRAMIAAGFKVEKLKGPPGKREMSRATSPLPSPPKVERVE